MICQLGYDSSAARLFAYLASNMLVENMAAGPPVYDSHTGVIRQSYGLCDHSSGSICTFNPVFADVWEVSYDDGQKPVSLFTADVHRFFSVAATSSVDLLCLGQSNA